MGYQESLLLLDQEDMDNALRAYFKAVDSGYYNKMGAEPLSVLVLKKPLGNLLAGSHLIWSCGDRCFHTIEGVFDNGFSPQHPHKFFPIERVFSSPDSPYLQGIHLEAPSATSNAYMTRFSPVNYAAWRRMLRDLAEESRRRSPGKDSLAR